MSRQELLPAYDELCGQLYNNRSNDVVATGITVSVVVNGTTYTLQPTGGSVLGATEVSPLLSTAEFIRTYTQWHGTKVACAEGGCGACTVAVTYLDHTTGRPATVGINACLRPILACNGMAITTNDGLVSEQTSNAGDRIYNPIQSTLAAHNGSQCGYCSNGFVMTMYTFLAEKSQRGGAVDALSIEEAFDGNLCRCTGYRPILDAMKSFAGGNSNLGDIFNNGPGLRECQKTGCCQKKIKFNFEHLPDMEDVSKYLGDDAKVEMGVQVDHKGCMSSIDRKRLLHVLERDVSIVMAMNDASAKAGQSPSTSQTVATTANASDPKWIPCNTITDLNTNLAAFSSQVSKPSIMLINGQTSLGVYKNTSADVRLYIGAIPDLKQITAPTHCPEYSIVSPMSMKTAPLFH
jgi:xanthine dehydrogenase iron-sulfur cluster and FAD-binding subunit A